MHLPTNFFEEPEDGCFDGKACKNSFENSECNACRVARVEEMSDARRNYDPYK